MRGLRGLRRGPVGAPGQRLPRPHAIRGGRKPQEEGLGGGGRLLGGGRRPEEGDHYRLRRHQRGAEGRERRLREVGLQQQGRKIESFVAGT